MLAHVGHLAPDPGAEVAHRELADGKRLEDTQALRVGRARPTAAYRSRSNSADTGRVSNTATTLSVFA